MKTQFNEETKRHEWVINKWYEKVAFVVGVIYAICFALGFIIGFLAIVNN